MKWECNLSRLIEIYFNEKFDNCRVLNTVEIEKWGVFDLAKKFIFEIRDRMQDIARGLVKGK